MEVKGVKEVKEVKDECICLLIDECIVFNFFNSYEMSKFKLAKLELKIKNEPD